MRARSTALFILVTSLPAACSGQTLAIRAENVLTISSAPIRNGIVLVKHGKIAAVGKTIAIPPGTPIIRAHTVMPGLIDAHSSLGVHGEVAESADSVTPDIRAADAFDPTDRNLSRALRSGVTSAAVMPPDSNVIGGQSAVVRLGRSPAVIREFAGVKFSISPDSITTQRNPTSRAGAADLITRAFTEASNGRPVSGAVQTTLLSGGIPTSLSQRVSPLSAILDGRARAFVHTADISDAGLALEWLQRFPGMQLALVRPAKIAPLVPSLKRMKVPVVIGPLRFTDSDLALSQPGELAGAGIPVSFCTNAPAGDPASLRLSAHLAVKFGMPRDAALRGLTSAPAALLGISDRVGSIAPGKDADLILLDGDPLDLTSRVKVVLVNGKPAYQEGK